MATKQAKEANEKLLQSQNETREVATKLRNLRRVCAKLIRSLNEVSTGYKVKVADFTSRSPKIWLFLEVELDAWRWYSCRLMKLNLRRFHDRRRK